MADEEDFEPTTPFAAATAAPAAFDESDNTVEIPHPKRLVFIMPNGRRLREVISESTLTTIKHPRHGSQQLVFVTPDGKMLEIQEHHRKFGSTWFIGEAIEPKSPMYVTTPLDLTFIAIYVLRGCISGTVNSDTPNGSVPTKFQDAYTLFGADAAIAILPPVCHAAIAQAFSRVADVANEDGQAPNASDAEGKLFYRFNEDKCVAWLKGKYEALTKAFGVGGDPQTVVSNESSPQAASSSSISLGARLGFTASSAPEKTAQLLSEYLDRINEPLLFRATGVDLAARRADAVNSRKTNNAAAMASRAALGSEAIGVDDIGGEPAEKKKRIEVKSASVKKLEKAGAPKGTPSLMSLFAKKAPPLPAKIDGDT